MGSVINLPAGSYAVTAQVEISSGLDEPPGVCKLELNGSVVSGTTTLWQAKDGTANLTIVTAVTVTGGSTADVICASVNSAPMADLNLLLVGVDSIN